LFFLQTRLRMPSAQVKVQRALECFKFLTTDTIIACYQ
jgi:hypothetical protein